MFHSRYRYACIRISIYICLHLAQAGATVVQAMMATCGLRKLNVVDGAPPRMLSDWSRVNSIVLF